MKPLLVTLTPTVWRTLATQAAGHKREGGGLLIGRWVRGHRGVHFLHEISLTHVAAEKSEVRYNRDELAHARKMAYATYGPAYEPVGAWHSHPWEACTANALLPQITTEGKDCDLEDMLDGEVEVICVTFPDPGYQPDTSEFEVQRLVGGIYCRAEAWQRVGDKARPCRIAVRNVR